MIGLVVFPALAASAPPLVELAGAMFTGRVLTAYITYAATNMIGIVIFAIAVWRAGVFPWIPALLFIAGGILFNLPAGAIPHIILVAGGVLWSIGALWFGLALWSNIKD